MKIEVNKNELERALIALGKLISRMSPIPEHKSLLIECKEGKVCFSTRSPSEQMTFRTACVGEVEFRCIVGFDEFRDAVRGYRNKALELEDNEGTLRVGERTLFPKSGVEWQVPDEGEHCSVSELPKDFVALFAAASPLVDRNNPRKVLQGINLCREGITTTNGRELLNIYVPLNVDDFTIPLPLALMQTRITESGTLCTWTDRTGKRCRIETEHWVWYAEGLEGNYPNWKQVIPSQKALVRSVSFLPERGQQLEIFLKNVPDQPPHNPVELYQSEPGYLNILAGEMHTSIAAEFIGNWNDVSIKLNKHVLLRLLSEGHTKIEACDGHFPILATGGTGRYITIPLYQPKTQEPKPIQTQTEEPKMENNEMRVVSAPVQTVVSNPEPVPETVDPMEELNHSIDELRGRLKLLLDETGVLTRKVKEAVLKQKQKERDFILAKRAIERIKMAI
ncbi:hypothetical protein HF882_17370 [Victivallis vadensis]|uniref:DNA polymerase III sliding clamp (Beta) subunit (PCNA family) n=1 Tax=Victivallis vadensis TaxID=172901 RepID=A0A848B409_9BACT|nr:hypothetical protein [Victivallis vadensis]AVM44048.1 hypothetical protein C5Q97_04710 [Victivallales bacterium CCUG 44730]NMD88359.1 hypothetical protein [Victivallis vadensis]